ncbi:hypothetical protein M409DRAFT_27730 [Zasmidium cellare ATCC 36951]|uniref:Uncharacterized protein n=1 Tax=Zasmidium cellare ATCC 36951 TaxID=1080233 RepID=A0A6A6C4R2_ZASCE|nr:uncharacterized protein M409DRAFT_27730 [Zasmidium cellare ATCC 36951]KAF2162005.1 hypothetical protein M409DRAFT_27730 [Zasmidium cellare ATCC 36951]
MSKDNPRHNALSLLFITPQNYDSFHAILQRLSSKHKWTSSEYVTTRFLQSYGQRLWPKGKRRRKHLNQLPTQEEVKHWASGKGRGRIDGPVFDWDGHLTVEGRHEVRPQDGRSSYPLNEDLSGSKLGQVLVPYVSDIISNLRDDVTQEDVRLADLIQRILATCQEGDLAEHHDIMSSTTSHPSKTRKRKPRSKRTNLNTSKSTVAGSAPATEGETAKDRNLKHSHNNGKGQEITHQSVLGDNFERGQMKLTSGASPGSSANKSTVDEEEDVSESIRKIRSAMYRDEPRAFDAPGGQKRPMEGSEANMPPPKKRKRKKGAKENSPPRGLFHIPRHSHRLEALPLRKPRRQQHGIADHAASLPRHDASVSLTGDLDFHADFRITEIPFNYMEDVTSMSQPHVDEEARSKTLAMYMKETGGMGGLPVVQ